MILLGRIQTTPEDSPRSHLLPVAFPIFSLNVNSQTPTQGGNAMGGLHDKMKAEFLLRGYSPNTYNGYLCRCRRFGR